MAVTGPLCPFGDGRHKLKPWVDGVPATLRPMPTLKNCECWKCKHQWQDYSGSFATLSVAHYPGDTEGCPKCSHLYWTETDAPGCNNPLTTYR